MKTKHYCITNLDEYSKDARAVEMLKKYLGNIESIFSTVEEVFGQAWGDAFINIELDGSKSGASYRRRGDSHVVKMGIYNGNIQKAFPENLWGCLFHETHHAFFNPIINNKTDKKIFNGSCEGEPFNYAFMATTYLKLEEKKIIDEKLRKHFFNKLEKELPDDAKYLYEEYVAIFTKKSDNFSEFISYLKSHDSAFTVRNNFRQDLDQAREFLAK